LAHYGQFQYNPLFTKCELSLPGGERLSNIQEVDRSDRKVASVPTGEGTRMSADPSVFARHLEGEVVGAERLTGSCEVCSSSEVESFFDGLLAFFDS